MIPQLQAILAKLATLFVAIQNSPQLVAWFETLFANPTSAKASLTGDAELRAAFDASPEVHAALREHHDAAGAGIDINGLFSIFSQLLPLILPLIQQFFPKKPTA